MNFYLISIVSVVLSFQLDGQAAVRNHVARSETNPPLLSFRGDHQVKLIGYDYYDLLNTERIGGSLDLRTADEKTRPLYASFFDTLARNQVNFTRCFVWCGWANDLFCWRRVSTPNDPVKQGQPYALVDLSEFDERFWNHAIKALE